MESLLTSMCEKWLSDMLAGAALIALMVVEPKELLQDRTSGALGFWKAAGPPKLCLEASITPRFPVQT